MSALNKYNVLVCGGNGFIGSYMVSALIAERHSITCTSRSPEFASAYFNQLKLLNIDFNHATEPSNWLPHLNNIDVVINCVGILTGTPQQNIDAIHYQAPLALYKACIEAKVKKVIHISALGVESEIDVEYVSTKAKLDLALEQLPIDSAILRPSLLYASGAFGGTSFFRALSALPLIPLIAKGNKRFQPLAMNEFTDYILSLVDDNTTGIINVVGPEKLSTKQILINLRSWLGLNNARFINIPNALVALTSKLGDFFSDGPLNSTSYQILMQENLADNSKYPTQTLSSSMQQGLLQQPSSVQDKHHAKSYFLEWAIFFSLVTLWFCSGALPLIFNFTNTAQVFIQLGWPSFLAKLTTVVSCSWDIGLACSLFSSKYFKLSLKLQLLTICIYSLLGGYMLPRMLVDPFGAFLKNIPIVVLTLNYYVMKKDK